MAMNGRRFKDGVYEQFARIGKALASAKRLELLDLLCQGERTVEVLAREAGATVANTSRHLQVLRAARLVEAEKRGLFVTYRLAEQSVCDLYREMRTLAERRLAELEEMVRAFFGRRDAMEAVDRKMLLERLRDGAALLVDVRPHEEYGAGHIAGAVSIPLRELRRRLDELPTDREIVAYCRGPYCVLAVEAVDLLHAQGFRASRLADGVADWRARGLPIERRPVRFPRLRARAEAGP